MTKRAKKLRREIKKDLQERGLIPHDKARLNRKKFLKEAVESWDNNEVALIADVYFNEAVSWMLPAGYPNGKVNSEMIGIAKLMKLMLRLNEFHEMVQKRKSKTYNMMEQHEYIKDILEA